MNNINSLNKESGKNIWFYGLDLLFVFIINFILNILYANLISIEEFAKFSLIWAIMNLISVLSIMGIPRALLRRIPELGAENRQNEFLNYFFVSIILITVFSLIISFITNLLGKIFYSHIPIINEGFDLLILLNSINSINLASYYFLIALKKMKFSFIGNFLKYGIYLFVTLISISNNTIINYLSLLIYFFLGIIISFLIEMALIIFKTNKLGNKFKFPNFDEFKKISKDIFPLAMPGLVSSFCGIFMLSYGIIILGIITGLNDISFFKISLVLAQAFYLAPVALLGSLFPYFVTIYRNDVSKFHQTYNSVFKVSIVLSVILNNLGILFAEQILSILTSNKYIYGAPILQIILIGLFFYGYNAQFLSVFYIFGKHKIFVGGNLSLILIYSCLSIGFFLLFRSVIGVAIGLTIGNLIVFIILIFLSSSKLKLKLFSKDTVRLILPILMVTAFMDLTLIYFRILFKNLITDLVVVGLGLLCMLFLVYQRFTELDFQFIRTLLQIEKEEINSNYENYKLDKIRHYDSKKLVKRYEKERFENIYGFLLDKVQKYHINVAISSKNQVALDIATGTGRFLFEIAHKIYRGIGIDTSLNMLRQARKNNDIYKYKNIDFVVADTEYLPIRSNHIDLITAIHILPHLRKFFKIYFEMNRVLKKGGKSIFDISNKNFIFRRILNKILKSRKKIYKPTQFKLSDIRSHFSNFNQLKIKFVKGIGIVIIYLFPSKIKRLFSKKHFNSFIFKILLKIEQILAKKTKIANYFSPDLLIGLQKV
ncbi:MAG: methyltransferase domain-containing protein [Candidatus Hodarchaeota archaeon]